MKPLELTIYPDEQECVCCGPIYTMPHGEIIKAYQADRMAHRKRLTPAELAAEYYRACYLYESGLADSDGYDGMPEVREHRRQSLILHRFARLPHYDEPGQ